MNVAPVAGTELRYRMDGTRGKPVLVLSNSLGTDHAMWEPQMAALRPHRRRPAPSNPSPPGRKSA